MIDNKRIYWIVTFISLCLLWVIIPLCCYTYLEYKQEQESIKTNEYIKNTTELDFAVYKQKKRNPLNIIEKNTLKNKIWKMESNAFNIRNYLQIEYREQNSSDIKELLNNYNKYWEFMFEIKNNFKNGIFIKKEILMKISEVYEIKNVSALRKYQPSLNSEIYASVIIYYVFVFAISVVWFSKKYRESIRNAIVYYYSK